MDGVWTSMERDFVEEKILRGRLRDWTLEGVCGCGEIEKEGIWDARTD